MYSYHQHKKKTELYEAIHKVKDQFIQQKERKIQLNQELSEQYRKRMESHIVSLINKPVKVQYYKSVHEEFKFREEDPDKRIPTNQNYYMMSRNKSKDKDSMISVHMSSSSVQNHSYRDRVREKELASDMRFKPNTRISRITDVLRSQTQTQVENHDQKTLRSLEKSFNFSLRNDESFSQRKVVKSILPSLHIKTNFNAAYEIYNKIPLSLRQKNPHSVSETPMVRTEVTQQTSSDMDYPTNRFSGVDKKKLDTEEYIDKSLASKEALIKCNLLPVISKKEPKSRSTFKV